MHALSIGARNLIRIRFCGALSAHEAEALMTEFKQYVEQLTKAYGGYRILIDLSDSSVQTQTVVELFMQVANSTARSESAFLVTPSALVRLQIKRIISHDRIRFFESLAGAEAWIDANPGGPP